jgi:hypothetical protein
MIHHSFSDLSAIARAAMAELPGVLEPTVLNAAASTFSEFCENTLAFREELTITLKDGVTTYSLVSPHRETMVIGVAEIVIDGRPILPGEWSSTALGRIEIDESLTSYTEAELIVILMPRHGNGDAPTDILDRWGYCLEKGIKARMMMIPEQDWSNPNLGSYYKREFETEMLGAAADVRNEFSVTRLGRAGVTRGPFEV